MSSRNQSKRTRHYPAASVRFVGHRDRSHPLLPSPPLLSPSQNWRTPRRVRFRGGGRRRRRREHRCSIGLLLPPLSLSFPSCTRYIHMQIYSASVRAPAYYAYTRGSAGPSRACCRCSGEGHKLNDVNALSTLCRRGETTHELSLSPSIHPYRIPRFSVPLSPLHRPSSDLDDPRQPLTRPLLTDYNYRGVPCGSPRMDEEER